METGTCCLFCLRISNSLFPHGNDERENEKRNRQVLQRNFLNLLRRHLLEEKIQLIFFIQPNEKIESAMEPCSDCLGVVKSFCDLYREIQILEIKLNWRLGTLVNFVRSSRKVKFRLNEFQRMLEDLKLKAMEELDISSFMDSLDNFRGDFINKCSLKIRSTYPKVKLKRILRNVGYNETNHPGSPGDPIEADEVVVDTGHNLLKETEDIRMLEDEEDATDVIQCDSDYIETKNEIMDRKPSTGVIITDESIEQTKLEITSSSNGYDNFIKVLSEECPLSLQTGDLSDDDHDGAGESSMGKSFAFDECEDNKGHPDDKSDLSLVSNEGTSPELTISEVEHPKRDLKTEENSEKKLEEFENVDTPEPVVKIEGSEVRSTSSCVQNTRKRVHPPKKNITTAKSLTMLTKKRRLHKPWKKSLQSLKNRLKTCNPEGKYDIKKFANNFKNSKRLHKCPKPNCKETFSSEEDLKTHSNLHSRFQCLFCEEVFQFAPDLSMHETEKHSSTVRTPCMYTFPCAQCKRLFRGKENYITHHLKDHLRLEVVEPTSCSICEHVFQPVLNSGGTVCRTTILIHYNLYHNSEGKDKASVYYCQVDNCKAYFIRAYQVRRHMNEVHSDADREKESHKKLIKCPDCPKKYANKKSMKAHCIKQHPSSNKFPYKCEREDCYGRFESMELLKTHMEYHKKACDPAAFSCPKCERSFSTKATLKAHMLSHERNSTKKPFLCTQCGKSWKNLGWYQAHLLSHSGPGSWQFTCETCGKKCLSLWKLQEHQNIHKKEDKHYFTCEHCGARYAHRHNFRHHLRDKHNIILEDARKKKRKS